MKAFITVTQYMLISFFCIHVSAQNNNSNNSSGNRLFIDVHHLTPGKITYADVAAAHAKDLATENKYGVNFINYWVDTAKGLVYCLSSAPDSAAISKTHGEAHGLLPDQVYMVSSGKPSTLQENKNLFLDVHEFGAGKVKANDVAAAHQKDLATENKYGVNFINYWVDEKQGVVMCLSQAPDSSAIIKTHKEAHGLVPEYVLQVQSGTNNY